MNTSLWQAQLEAGLKALELSLSTDQQTTLVDFLALLAHWNKAFNLTACLLYTSPSPRDKRQSRMPSSA